MVSRADRGPLADWFWTIDRYFLAAFILLMGIGFMLSFAASPAVAERIGLDSFHFVERHALFIVPSIAVMIGVCSVIALIAMTLGMPALRRAVIEAEGWKAEVGSSTSTT